MTGDPLYDALIRERYGQPVRCKNSAKPSPAPDDTWAHLMELRRAISENERAEEKTA